MKTAIIFILATISLFTENAQKVCFGIKGHLNVSSFHFNDL